MDIEKVKAFEAGNYELKAKEAYVFYAKICEDAWGAIELAYKYGLMRGQNAEKNRARRARKAAKV